MQSDMKGSEDSRDPRSIPPRRISHFSRDPNKRSQSRDSDSGRSKRKDVEDDDSDFEQYNFEKLKKFHIPRKKGKEEKDLLDEISLTSREYTHSIYQPFRTSFFDNQSGRKLVINQAELVHNEKLEKEYLTKKKDMKDDGRSENDLKDSFGFLHFFKRHEVEKVCKDGVHVGHCNITTLGKPDMGVYICKHADIIRFSKWNDSETGYIVMFKIMKGKTKLVTECRTPVTEQEPTPLYDCHITKLPIQVVQAVHSRAYQAIQYYFYEYGDIDIVQRPRQVLPYAVLKYTYRDIASTSSAASRTSRRESSVDEVFTENSNSTPPPIATLSDNGFCHWRGILLVKNGTFCSVEMRSHLDTVFNVANVDRNINIKTCLPLEKLKRQLPPTLMSRSAKKYNVIYRGRHYNTFTLHPTDEGSGLGKFRQLISHLVQRSAAAFIPLRNNSSLYLLPLSGLTEEMGLQGSLPEITATSESSKQSQRAWKNFLHVIIITPKALSSKINDQRVFNIIHTRKRKDTQSSAPMSSVRDALEQKLRQMNIDPSMALSSMEPEQQQKIFERLKEKKKLQSSEKMLHNHYKEVDNTPSSLKAEWKKKLYDKWFNVAKTQQEMYSAKKKLKVIPSPGGNMKRTLSRNSDIDNIADISMEDVTEATFSDDEDTIEKPLKPVMSLAYKIPKKPRMEEPPKVTHITNVPFDTGDAPVLHRPDPRTDPVNKPKVPFKYTPAAKPKPNTTATATSILRPSFKPLEELIFSENLEELMKHPEFTFTEKHCLNHKVSGFSAPFHANSPYTPWEENQPRITITFAQETPHPQETADCPYAFENDPLVLSMLRAIHGDYNGSEDTPQEHAKVNWVRRILHNRDAPNDEGTTVSNAVGQASGMARKIVEHVEEKSSPQFTEASPHLSSTDSGFVSSSAAGTPGDIPIPDSPSLKDIAAIIASALTQTKAQVQEATPKVADPPPPKPEENSPDVELAAKALLEALTQKGSDAETTVGSQDDMEGVDMEIGSTPEQSPTRERSRSREPGPSLIASQTDEGTKPPPLMAGQHTQGPAGKIPLRLPQSHPLSHPRKMSIRREEATLAALRKVIPGITKKALHAVLARVAPLITKMMVKMKQRTSKITNTGTITKTTPNTRTLKGETEKLQRSHGMSTEIRKMTITLTPGRNVHAAKAGTMTIAVQNTNIPGLDLVKNQIAENLPPRETIMKNPIEAPKQTGTMNVSGRPRFVLPGGSGGLGYSATDPSLITTTTTTQAKHPIPHVGAASSVPVQLTTTKILPTTTVVPPSAIGTIITQRGLPKEGSSLDTQSVAPIGTIITQRASRWYEHRGVERGPLTRIRPTRGPAPYYPIPARGPYLAAAPLSMPILPYQGQGYTGVGDNIPRANPFYPPSSISAQNTELLRTILNLINPPKQDPRLASTQPQKMQGTNIYANPNSGSSTTSQVPSQSNSMSSQISTILQQLQSTGGDTDSPSSFGSSATSAAVTKVPKPDGLSMRDIQRIREKKERRKELCRREAMHMREELNKNIKSKSKSGSKKTKAHRLSRTPGSPESTNSSNSGEVVHQSMRTSSSEQTNPQFSLWQPASEKVLQDVAAALCDEKPETATPQTLAMARPTGVVTPTPRSVQPVFMQSENSSTEVTSSSSSRDVTDPEPVPEELETEIPSNATEVISEIDTALSQLKQGLQSKRNNDELKESMGKLLQLVLKLDGGSSAQTSIASEDPSTSTVVPTTQSIQNQRDSEQGDLRDTLNAARGMFSSSESSGAEMPAITTVTSNLPATVDTVSSVVAAQTSEFRSILESVPKERVETAEPTSIFGSNIRNVVLSSEVAEERDKIVREYENQSTVTTRSIFGKNANNVVLSPAVLEGRDEVVKENERQSTATSNTNVPTTSPQPNSNMDEILDKLRPYIQDMNKNKEAEKALEMTNEPAAKKPKIVVVQPEPEKDSTAENQIKPGLPTAKIEPITHTEDNSAQVSASPTSRPVVEGTKIRLDSVQAPPSITSRPVGEGTIIRPQPTHQDSADQKVPAVVVHPVLTLTPATQVIPAQPPPAVHATLGNEVPHHLYDPHIQHLAVSSPMSVGSDRGSTPTLDERYPEPVRPRKRKRRTSGTSQNSFVVFDPENSMDCDAISTYLLSVKGTQFDVSKMAKDLTLRIADRKENQSTEYETTKVLEDEFRKVLPQGTIWVVSRTIDLKHLHFMPHLALLKAAGSHIQFVAADGVRDVKARQYKNIMSGDGGIVIPLCPKTLLNKIVQFRLLMLWLIGQDKNGKSKNKWRITLHQHLLGALQDAERIGTPTARQNATQALEWLCHISKNKSKLAIELPEHQCDKMRLTKAKGVWNQYDSATDEELVKTVLPCLMKLQMDKVRQLRHVVVLIDGDPGAVSWKAVWQSGCCVTTMDKFVDLVCSKPAGTPAAQSTSCVLPLYTPALSLL